MSNKQITLTIFNITGLRKQAIDSVISYTTSTDLLFLTETWLISPNKYYTSWTQYHTYGIRSTTENSRGRLGISLMVNPSCPYHVHFLPNTPSPYSLYSLSCIVANTLIHCVYLPPEKISDQFALEVLESLPLHHTETNNTIICGDFNARLGNITGDSIFNPRGRLLQPWISSNSLTLWNKEKAYGQPTFLRHAGSSIIDLYLSTQHINNTTITITDGKSHGSDHKMVHFNFEIDHSTTANAAQQLPQRRRLWKLNKLTDDDQRQQFKESFNFQIAPINRQLIEKLQKITQHTPNNYITTLIDDTTNKFYEVLYNAMDTTLGTTSGGHTVRTNFWTRELQRLADHREFCYQK
ncbi:Endonuclease/exonuclease/phosphatase [Circinella umbellata]|nr:Endonuclease/exonuclease/phosphatase [Circinella umbellata]